MQKTVQFLKFYLIAALFIGGLVFIISLILSAPEIGNMVTISEALLVSAFNGVVNGLLHGLIATLFLTIAFHYKSAKIDKHNKRILDDRH